MKPNIERFKQQVTEAAARPSFIHHRWFVQYHLELVERIASELLDRHPEADADTVMVLVWLHDYGKILDFNNQYAKTLSAGRKVLQDCGFNSEFVDRVMMFAELIDKKMEVDLSTAPIEVQIVASADAASHHVGPFMSLYWWENADKPFTELMEANRRKTMKDWDRKMVLPEVREAFKVRHELILDSAGEFPDKFLP